MTPEKLHRKYFTSNNSSRMPYMICVKATCAICVTHILIFISCFFALFIQIHVYFSVFTALFDQKLVGLVVSSLFSGFKMGKTDHRQVPPFAGKNAWGPVWPSFKGSLAPLKFIGFKKLKGIIKSVTSHSSS